MTNTTSGSIVIDLRNHLPPVRSQGQRSTCLAFATTCVHEYAREAVGTSIQLSEEHLYWKCKQRDGKPAPGSGIETVAEVLADTGQIEQYVWPYDFGRPDSETQYTAPDTVHNAGTTYQAIIGNLPLDISAFEAILRSSIPLVLSIYVTESFFAPVNGMINAEAKRIDGAHAVAVVGLVRQSVSRGYLIFRNSWGERWGDGGYGYLPFEYLKKHGRYARAIEQIQQVKP